MTMQTYTVDIAGEPVTLPIVLINPPFRYCWRFDMGLQFGERIGNAGRKAQAA